MWSSVMGAEEICRSMYFAERLRREYGVSMVSAMQNDIPGCSWAYPQAMRKSGVKYFVLGVNTFIGPGAEIPVKDRPFYWEGPDGSRILTYICSDPEVFEGGYVMAVWEYKWGPGGEAEKTVPDLLARLEKAGYPYDSILVMAGTGDNGGAFPTMLEGAREWNSKHTSPKMVIATPEEFFTHMEAKYADKFPVYRGDWAGLWDQNAAGTPYGTGLSRRVHDELPASEALASIADALGLRSYPRSETETAWRNVITYDEHSGGGGWPGTVTKEQTDEGDKAALAYAQTAHKLASGVFRKSTEALSSAVKSRGNGIFVWNPLPSERAGFVRIRLDETQFNRRFDLSDDSTGKPVPYQKVKPTREIIFRAADIPALGYRTLSLAKGESDGVRGPTSGIGAVAVRENGMENDLLRVELDERGFITSILDKRTGTELVDRKAQYGFGQLVSNAKDVASSEPKITIGLNGPLAGSLVITDSKSPLARTEITLYAGSPVIHFRHALDLRRTPHAPAKTSPITYDIAYPLDIPDAELRYDTPAGMLDPKSDLMPKAFHIINVHHGGDVTGRDRGVSFASRQAFLWEFRQINWIWGTPIPPETTALMMRLLQKHDEGEYKEGIGERVIEPGAPKQLTFECAFYVHGGSPDDLSAVREFLVSEANPLSAVLIGANPKGSLPSGSGGFINLEGKGFSLLTLKRAENGDGYVLRLMETAGRASSVRSGSGLLAIRSAELLDNVENPIKKLSVRNGSVRIELHPREIVTLRLVGLSKKEAHP
ncbi:MAG: glycosyl hydrolase-related protein, partial [Armatimonadetes bacterium]|nr:glycosyl hydrolase-related protein [Armatimonadota bacterium]